MPIGFFEERDKDIWNSFVIENNGDFLQSWEWGELQEREGRKINRFAVCQDRRLLAAFQLYNQRSRLGQYLYLPHGPVLARGAVFPDNFWEETFPSFLKNLSPKAIFIICEPLKNFRFQGAEDFPNRQPPTHLIIDLTKPSAQILKEMACSRRQGISFAGRQGVIVNHEPSLAYLDDFWSLLTETSQRKKFGIFPKAHYENIQTLLPSEIFLGRLDQTSLCAGQVVFWGKTAAYLHAASHSLYKKLRSPDLLIWTIIEESKRRGLERLDLWGVDSRRRPGVTAFKKSFGGTEITYPTAKIIPIHYPKFYLYKLARWLLR